MKAPNLLFVFADQHRMNDLPRYGNQEVYAPNLTRFSEKAAVMEGCICNCPLCVPSRGSMLTGLMPISHRAVTNDLPMDTSLPTIATYLRKNGYKTGYIGKWHLGGIPRDKYIDYGQRGDFEYWKVCNCNHDYLRSYYYDEENIRHEIEGYEPDTQTDLAIDFINQNQSGLWAAVLSWGPPHEPYFEVPQKYLDLYNDKQLTLRENVSDVTLFDRQNNRSIDEISKLYKGYYAHMSALDYNFGRLIETLEKTGQLENTIIVYTSDHGDLLGSHGYLNKQQPFAECMRVPLLVYWQGHTVAYKANELIGLADLPVSLLSLMGIEMKNTAGQDLSGLFLDKNAKGLDECYIYDLIPCHQPVERGQSGWRGVITKEYTFACSTEDNGYVLYNDRIDRYQMNNLINDMNYRHIKEKLYQCTLDYAAKYDKYLPWQELTEYFGLKEKWNESQSYFGLPTLD